MKQKALAVRLMGVFLLLTSGLLAFVWFYWLAPMRHLRDSDWIRMHSVRQRWIEEQKQIHRSGVDHDSSIGIGRFGDKAWTEWVIRQLNSSRQEQGMRSCGEWPYHLDTALCKLANQRMTNNAAWLDWWEKNKDKTQLDWIREGFAQQGIVLRQPLTTNSIVDLLKLVHSSTNFTVSTNNISGGVLPELRYNALRWLRDSSFEPHALDLKTLPAANKDDIALALTIYARWLGENWDAPGELPLSEKSDWNMYGGIHPIIAWVVYLLLLLLTISGVLLLRQKAG